MSTLITGGTGFVGAQVVRLLVEQGQRDLVLFDVNPSTKLLDDIAAQVEIIRGDLGNFSHILNAVQSGRPDVIFHLGGMFSVPAEADPPAALRANALGTFHVLEAARLFSVPQVILASTLATYGLDLEPGAPVDDFSLQRPELFYGATKVFGELMGLFYRRKYGLDFRGVRYPALVGPGVATPGVVQYMARMIEESIKGNPFTVPVAPETRTPAMYFKDAARAVIELAQAPREGIRMVNYLVAGATPIATARELAAVVRARVPGAQITFAPDPSVQGLLDRILHPPDDRMARAEWGWRAQYSLDEIVDDFLREMQTHPQRYA